MAKLILEVELGNQTEISMALHALAANSTELAVIPMANVEVLPNEPAEMLMADIARENNVPEEYPNPETAFTATESVGVELDSVGCPWDERIHASTKSKLQSGEWKLKRGVDDATVQQVKSEIMPPAPATPPTPVVDTPTPPAPPAPVVDTPAPPTPPTPSNVNSFADLQLALKTKGVQMSQILAATQKHGVAAFPLLAAQSVEVIRAVAAELGV